MAKSTRYDEYIQVLETAHTYLKNNMKNDDYVIIVAGDIVHDYRKAGANCIGLFIKSVISIDKDEFKRLSSMRFGDVVKMLATEKRRPGRPRKNAM